MVEYLRNNLLTSDGIHLKEFMISYQVWDSYLHRMSQDSAWGDWITLWYHLNIDIAIVPTDLQIISPGDASNKKEHDFNKMALLGQKAKEH